MRFLGLLALSAVVYGSLLPFDLQPFSLATIRLSLANCAWRIVSWTDLITNVILYFPAAWLLSGSFRLQGMRVWSRLILLLPLFVLCVVSIELTQLFLPTRTFSCTDIVSNLIGSAFGIVFFPRFGPRVADSIGLRLSSTPSAPVIWKRHHNWVIAGYIGLLIAAQFAHLAHSNTTGNVGVAARLGYFFSLPFARHYYAANLIAAASMIYNFAAYFPIGVFDRWIGNTRPNRSIAAAIAVALLVELIKIVSGLGFPDCSNVIIGAVAAWFGYRLTSLMSTNPDARDLSRASQTSAVAEVQRYSKPGALLCVFALSITYWGITTFPFAQPALAVGLAVYAIALFYQPNLWLFAIPALLPVFDLAPWSGHALLDEFDLVVLITLGIVGLKLPASDPTLRNLGLKSALFAYLASAVIACLIGAVPFEPLNSMALANPYSHYNSLHTAKGIFEASMLTLMMARQSAHNRPITKWFLPGVVYGLIATGLVTLWERHAFAGLLDFSQSFRISALFSSMHTGGSHIETYLALALPWALLPLLIRSNSLAVVPATLACLLGIYAMYCSYARAGYVAFAVELIVLFICLMIRNRNSSSTRTWSAFLLASLIGITFLGLTFVGGFARERILQSEGDAHVRFEHWASVLKLRQPGWLTTVFGMGLGSYPRANFVNSVVSREKRAFWSIEHEQGNWFLRLQSTRPVYFEQIMNIAPATTYTVTLKVRSLEAGAVRIMLCERGYYDSRNCRDALTTAGAEGWRTEQLTIDSGKLASRPVWDRPLTKLVVEQIGEQTVDIDDLTLTAPGGSNLVNNGDFSRGLDRWWFTDGDHLAWHAKNSWVASLFEQGQFGLVTLLSLSTLLVLALVRKKISTSYTACASLASVAGFFVISIVDSLLDAPRLSVMVGMSAAAGLFSKGEQARQKVRLHRRAHRNFAQPVTYTDSFRLSRLGLAFILMTLALTIALYTPGTPYNLRKLISTGHAFINIPLFALTFLWFFGGAAWLAERLSRNALKIWQMPLALSLYVAASYLLVRSCVPLFSIHKIVGTALLNWPWEWEMLGRLSALLLTCAWLLVAAFLVALRSRAPLSRNPWPIWLVVGVPLFAGAHWIIVGNPATDNLVELMRDGGTLWGSLALGGAFLLTSTGGALLGAAMSERNRQSVARRLVFVSLLAPVVYGALWLGTEPLIIKYGQPFSALQFMLSQDRANYAEPGELLLRFLIAYSGVVAVVGSIFYLVLPIRHKT